MAYLDNKMQKVMRQNSRETRVKRDQTFSAQRKSEGRFGTHGSTIDPDDPRGMIRMYAAARHKRPPVTLPKMPWEKL